MSHFVCTPERPLVRTAAGLVHGYHWNGLDIFKGIPYAQARRFHAPEPAKPWKGVLDATNYGYVCPLMEMPKPQGELLTPHRYWVMDENCQNLNVWTPGCDLARRPVLVWLHGGGYVAGSSIEQIAYEGENMAKLGDCVVVSINHRLNVLGYLDLSAFGEEYANSGNAGGDDIVMALRWVRDNIAAFGGDPDNVTVFGQSGGGAKVITLLQTPAADGLFHRGIVMSGVIDGLLADSVGTGEACGRALLEELGLSTVQELEAVPYAQLAAAYLKVQPALAKAGKNVGGIPHANEFYLGDPLKHGFRKESLHVPLLVGTVFAEFAGFFGPKDGDAPQGIAAVKGAFGDAADDLLALFAKAYPQRDPVDLLSMDCLFRAPSSRLIRARAAAGGKVYSYLFDQDFEAFGRRVPWHCADIPFFFHNVDLVPVANIPGVSEQLQEQIFGMVMAFARTGDPAHAGIPAWPASTEQDEATMIFSAQTHLVHNHDQALMQAAAPALMALALQAMQSQEDQIQH